MSFIINNVFFFLFMRVLWRANILKSNCEKCIWGIIMINCEGELKMDRANMILRPRFLMIKYKI